MLVNTETRWGSVSKALHWIMALMIAFEVPLGFIMTATYAASLRDKDVRILHVTLNQVHYTIGFTLLLLVALRLLWRLRYPIPALPPAHTRRQRWLARGTHWALYLLLFVLPLSGWAAMSVLGDTERFGASPIWLFAWDIVPPMLDQRPLDDPLGYAFFARIHRWAIYLGGVLLALHVAAALHHHLLRRDGLLWRMWPGTHGDQQQ